jgi:F0F1-type ATP synthase assembly protein I
VKEFTSGDPGDDGGSVQRESTHQRAASAGRGWVAGGDFFTSIIAAFLLGFVADKLAGTDPLFTVIGIIVGSVWGFYKMILWSREETARGR